MNFDIYAHLLQARANLKALEKGRKIHSLIIRNGIFPNAFLGTRHANMYAKCEILADAHLSFDVMPKINVFSSNTMIGVCANDGHYEEAIEIYQHMLDLGFKPDHFTFPSVLKACASLEALIQGNEIHCHIENLVLSLMFLLGMGWLICMQSVGVLRMHAKCLIECVEGIFFLECHDFWLHAEWCRAVFIERGG